MNIANVLSTKAQNLRLNDFYPVQKEKTKGLIVCTGYKMKKPMVSMNVLSTKTKNLHFEALYSVHTNYNNVFSHI